MSPRQLKTPGDDAPRRSAPLGEGKPLDLAALAGEICRRYRREFPDEAERYGELGNAWCVHDSQHLLNWGVEAVNGVLDLNSEVGWLAGVLEAREFPISRLARGLDIGADVVREHVGEPAGLRLADALAGAAAYVRSSDTFLDYTM